MHPEGDARIVVDFQKRQTLTRGTKRSTALSRMMASALASPLPSTRPDASAASHPRPPVPGQRTRAAHLWGCVPVLSAARNAPSLKLFPPPTPRGRAKGAGGLRLLGRSGTGLRGAHCPDEAILSDGCVYPHLR